jgi:hypothetical protein
MPYLTPFRRGISLIGTAVGPEALSKPPTRPAGLGLEPGAIVPLQDQPCGYRPIPRKRSITRAWRASAGQAAETGNPEADADENRQSEFGVLRLPR